MIPFVSANQFDSGVWAQVSVKVKVKAAQLCPALCNPKNYTAHGILQARILKWVAFPLSRDPPNPGIKPRFPALQADSLPAEPQGKPSVMVFKIQWDIGSTNIL